MTFPAMNMRRVYLIARRDFLGYVKTWGFWISFFLPFIFGAFGFFLSQLDINVEPPRYETILDETGSHGPNIVAEFEKSYLRQEQKMIDLAADTILGDKDGDAFKQAYKQGGFEAARAFLDDKYPGAGKRLKAPSRKVIFIDPPANSIDGLQPYLKGENLVRVGDRDLRIDGVLHIYDDSGSLGINYWSPKINSDRVKSQARRYFRAQSERNYLSTGGLTPEGLSRARAENIGISSFDPTKDASAGADSQAVTFTDRLPYIVAAILAGVLWLTVFSGSYMLLTSMLEEKLNKLMEMMLASTRFSEIMFGKLIGVAALTITAMAPYILIGIAFLIWLIFYGDPEVAAGLSKAFTPKLMIFFVIFLVLGYVFYGAFFIAVGALAESMQDAQTLTTPIMLILTSCIMVVPLSINSPDSPIIDFAAWFPLSAPFAAIVKLPSDPPWWELSLSALFLFILTIGVVWAASRIFQYGVLSGAGVKGVKSWFMRVIFRRKSA